MPLVEREGPLAALREYALDAQRGEGRLVLIAGEAGVGKSVLVESFQDALPDADWAWGGCDGLSTPRPLAPLFDLAGALGGRLQELTRGRGEREVLFRALLEQVTADRDRLTVLVLEDIHWADEATLDLLRFLARRVRSACVMVVATYRDDALPAAAPLRLALGELVTLRWARRVELAALSPDAVLALAAGTDLDPHDLYELTGGNPFYVTEMIDAGARGIPMSARDAVLARAGRLSEDASKVLSSASLIGNRIEQDLLSTATGCTPELLDELVDSGLLVAEGSLLRFRHEIARLAVEQQLASHRRRAVHADVYAALLSLERNDDARLAFHAEGAGDVAAVLHHSSRAARQAAELGSHREATAQYERALRSADDADQATVATLLTGLAREASLGDRWQTAADADEQALALWEQLGDRRQLGETLGRYSMALKNLCRGDEGLAAAEHAVRILEPMGSSVELASAYATLATVKMMRNERAASVDLAKQAQDMGREFGAIDVIADALNTEGCSMVTSDSEWAEPVRRSLELALSHNLQSQAGRAYNNLYSALVDQYRFDEAEQYFVDGTAYCDEHDMATYTYCLRSSRTTELQHRGQWDESVAMSRQLLEESTTSPLNRISPHTRIGTICARRGQPGAWESLDQAISTVEDTGQPQCIVPVLVARAEAYWLEGRDGEALQEVERAADVSLELDDWTQGTLDAWLRRLGSDRGSNDASPEPFRLQHEGRHAAASLAWSRLGCPYDAAMALLDAGDEASLRRALATFHELGALAAARVARQRLRELGASSIPAGPRRATRAHPLGLTPREGQVLELICDRRTNAEIARELFISTKTVDHHVSAVLAKLDAENREGAVTAAFRLGLVSVGAD
jgi:DNA-binding CsgD family transcriptional regulator/tetratricopeptide (TPR) repeat protein